MTKIADELQINAKHLRERAKRLEAAWREAKGITRLSKRSAESKASKRTKLPDRRPGSLAVDRRFSQSSHSHEPYECVC